MTSRALKGWRRYESVLGQCGTHESWFSHARALDTVLGYSQVAVGIAYYYELTSRVLEVWGKNDSDLAQYGTHESWFSHARALDIILGYSQVAIVLHNTMKCPTGPWKDGEGMIAS